MNTHLSGQAVSTGEEGEKGKRAETEEEVHGGGQLFNWKSKQRRRMQTTPCQLHPPSMTMLLASNSSWIS